MKTTADIIVATEQSLAEALTVYGVKRISVNYGVMNVGTDANYGNLCKLLKMAFDKSEAKGTIKFKYKLRLRVNYFDVYISPSDGTWGKKNHDHKDHVLYSVAFQALAEEASKLGFTCPEHGKLRLDPNKITSAKRIEAFIELFLNDYAPKRMEELYEEIENAK